MGRFGILILVAATAMGCLARESHIKEAQKEITDHDSRLAENLSDQHVQIIEKNVTGLKASVAALKEENKKVSARLEKEVEAAKAREAQLTAVYTRVRDSLGIGGKIVGLIEGAITSGATEATKEPIKTVENKANKAEDKANAAEAAAASSSAAVTKMDAENTKRDAKLTAEIAAVQGKIEGINQTIVETVRAKADEFREKIALIEKESDPQRQRAQIFEIFREMGLSKSQIDELEKRPTPDLWKLLLTALTGAGGAVGYTTMRPSRGAKELNETKNELKKTEGELKETKERLAKVEVLATTKRPEGEK